MWTSVALLVAWVAMGASALPPPQPATQPVEAAKSKPQQDLAPDETENLQGDVDVPAERETPGEWKKRMVRPCTRVGNKVTC